MPFWMSFARPDSVKPGCCVRCKMRGQRIRTFWPQKCMLEKKRKMAEHAEKSTVVLKCVLNPSIRLPEWLRLADTAAVPVLFFNG